MKEFVVNSPETLAKAIELMAKSHVIGYDTEFVSEESFRPELCLVQLAIPGNLFVVDPFSSGPLDGMWQLLTEGSREIVVHSGREEIRICQAESSKVPSRLFDIQI
ncbi:ribonuclease D, partial [bacterium]|nr:ribonuclease D [bacterium]